MGKDSASLFDDFSELTNRSNTLKNWVKSFLKLKHIWQRYDYITTCVSGADGDKNKGLAIFCRRIRDYYNKYCLNEQIYTEQELRYILIIMINNGLYLTSENIEKVYKHIQQGFYREYLTDVDEQIRKEENEEEVKDLVDSIDWGDF